MPPRDPLELRRHQPTVPNDLNDPPRFSQMLETAQDAFVLELRQVFEQAGFTTEDRELTPTVDKYAIGYGEGLDPYETYVKIVAEFPDVLERLPHLAVTTVSGRNNRMTAGRPFIGHTQLPPRVTTANPGPYVLPDATPEVRAVSVQTLPVAPAEVYSVTVDGVVVTETFDPGATAADIASRLAAALRASQVGLQFRVTSTVGANAQIILEQRSVGVAFVVDTSSNLASSLLQAAGNAAESGRLVLRTRPNGVDTTSVIVFPASRFATTEPLSAAPAGAVARVLNEQALYVTAREVPVGVGSGIQLEIGGKLGARMPNAVEVMPESTPALVAALGLAVTGTAVGGDSIGGVQPAMTLNVAGAAFTSALIGHYVTLAGATSAVNNGRFLITDVPAPTQLVFDSAAGVAEPFTGTYFIGFRDDSNNPLRPVMNRYHISMQLQVTVDVLAESPNERREVLDIVLGHFLFGMEEKFFTFYGRGVFDPDQYPDEHYQISVAQEAQDTGTQDFPRGEDQKNKIYSSRVSLPVTINWYVDRPVLVPSGPSVGRSWTLEGSNVMQDESLPAPS